MSEDPQPRDRTDEDAAWCALCGRASMPVVVDLPDGCVAHPGCAGDSAFDLEMHDAKARA